MFFNWQVKCPKCTPETHSHPQYPQPSCANAKLNYSKISNFLHLLSGPAKAAMKWTRRCLAAAVSSWGAWCEPRCPSRRWCCCCSAWLPWCRRRKRTSLAPWPTRSPAVLSPCSATPMVHPQSKPLTQLPIQFLHLETKLIMRTKKLRTETKTLGKENFAMCLSSSIWNALSDKSFTDHVNFVAILYYKRTHTYLRWDEVIFCWFWGIYFYRLSQSDFRGLMCGSVAANQTLRVLKCVKPIPKQPLFTFTNWPVNI